MPATTLHALPYPAQLVAGPGPDVPSDVKLLADAIDAKLTPMSVGAGSPTALAIAAGKVGRRHRNSTNGDIYLDIGAAWVLESDSIFDPGNGIDITTRTISTKLSALPGLSYSSGGIQVATDDVTVDKNQGAGGFVGVKDGGITGAKVNGALKPSVSAAAGTEALRALGTTAGTAAAGNDSRLSDARAAASVPSAVLTTGVHIADLYTNRPTATSSLNGVRFFATDKMMEWQCIGGSWVLILVFAPEGTSMPSSPIDQQEYIYIADTTLGIKYHFRYRAGSASAYKWECIGGNGVLQSFVATVQTRTLNTYGDLATVGPSVVVPLAGDWIPTVSMEVTTTGANAFGDTDIQIGATVADGSERVVIQGPLSGGSISMTGHREMTFVTVAAAATTVKMMYRSDGTNSTSYGTRRLAMRPVRVA